MVGRVWFIKIIRSNFTTPMKGKMKIVILLLLCANLYGHDEKDDFINWKRYFRLSAIQSENNNYGAGTYFRIKRSTKYTFRDLRLFAHQISEGNSYFKLRYKDSNKFIKLNKFYKFTVISFDRNEKIGLHIRSHGSQGVGFFLLNYKYGHINTELSFSYDMMDHLNDTKKTSYLKIGAFWDNDLPLFETKLEIESIFQISDIVDDDLSRIELLFEFYYLLMKNINIIAGVEMENYFHQPSGHSIFFSIGYKAPLNWKY